MAPAEIYAIRENGSANDANWKVRVVANKFAALVPEGSPKHREEERFFRNIGGFGYHEVIIETP
ncbi:MAG: galactose-1-phosphate uridylyltransferase, partial [Planctomycetota bacterium]